MRQDTGKQSDKEDTQNFEHLIVYGFDQFSW